MKWQWATIYVRKIGVLGIHVVFRRVVACKPTFSGWGPYWAEMHSHESGHIENFVGSSRAPLP
jgi:hypothetical protein